MGNAFDPHIRLNPRAARIGQNIRSARQHKKVSPQTVQSQLGLSPGELEAIENGEISPSLEQAGELATLYGVTVNSFFYHTGLYHRSESATFFGLEWPFSDYAIKVLDELNELQDLLA